MSTKVSLKFEMDAATGQQVHLYREVFEEGYVYLDLTGFPFEASIFTELSDRGRVAVRLTDEWARRLGLLNA